MKLGLSTYAAAWEIGVGEGSLLDPTSFLRLVSKAGLRVAQFADNLPLDRLALGDRGRLRNLAASLGVEVEVGTRGLSPGNLRAYLEIAREFDSSILRVVIDTATFKPTLDEIIKTLKGFRPRLEDAGVTLAIENHDRFRCAQFVDMIESAGSPNIGICLDTVNSFGAQEGPEVVIETLGSLTVDLHVKDFRVTRPPHQMGFTVEGTPAGRGQLDIPHLLSRLHEVGSDPNALLELWVSPEPSIGETIEKERNWRSESIDYLRRLIPG